MSRGAFAFALRRVALLLAMPGGDFAARRLDCAGTLDVAHTFRELGSWRAANWLVTDHARRRHAGGPCPAQLVSSCCAAPVEQIGHTVMCSRCRNACAATQRSDVPWWRVIK